MITSTILGIITLAGLLSGASGEVNFDSLPSGSAPPNWTVGVGADSWLVRADSSAPSRKNVLESPTGNEDAPVAVFNSVVCRDGELSVKFRIDPKASTGAAGIVWRYRDARNYHVLDFNPTRQTISLFRVVDGVRTAIPENPTSAPAKIHRDIRAGEWHVAKVSFRGNYIRVFFGNRRLFEATDRGVSQTGKVGVVTSGSTVAAFDDFRIDKKS